MNRDLEEELKANPELRGVVARLKRAAGGADDVVGGNRRPTAAWHVLSRPAGALLAATLLMALTLALWHCPNSPEARGTKHESRGTKHEARGTTSSYGAREYRQTPAEMIASQRTDGSWQNDFLTRRNAEALSSLADPQARIAYKKALRNLRSRGIL